MELAIALSKHFGRVTYNCSWRSAFPSSMQTRIGEGIPGVERVMDIAEVIDETDLFVFPDIHFGDMQLYLQDLGMRVWGSRNADELERVRSEAKPYFKSLGIPIPGYELVTGIEALRKYLKGQKEKLWIKIDETRKDTETFAFEGYDPIKNKLDQLEFHLGPRAETMKFTVEENLTDTCDLALDTYCVDGVYPNVTMLGIEEKDECYLASRKDWDKTPEGLQDIYMALSDTFKGYGYRGPLSLECRAGKQGIYLTDPCCRYGSPVFELQLEMIKNWPDIMWYGSEGKVIDPEIPSKYGAELVIQSDWCKDHPLLLEYPEEIADHFKIRYRSEFEGKSWVLPQSSEDPGVGAIVDHGNDLEACIENCKEMAAKVKGIQIENFSRAFGVALDKIKRMKQWGIDFR